MGIVPTGTPNNLAGLCYETLPLGSIRPLGWLADQLAVQAKGLSGHLDEFWPDIADSGWIGGEAEGWERGPYWLDGMVPLAFLLDDQVIRKKVTYWIDYIIGHQHDDGWLGPIQSKKGKYQAYDPWPIFVLLKVFTQYFEATGDGRVIQAMQRFLRRLNQLLDEQPLFVWGKSRWADLVVSVHWLYRITGDVWLLDLAAKVKSQGFDWRQHFADFKFTKKTTKETANQTTHVVNNAMAIKAPGVWYLQSGDEGDRKSVYEIIAALDRYHGQVTGVFSGDEHLAGRSPSQGTELCAVVEYMYSLEVLLCILGDPTLADRLEQIAYNALPATITPDMWAHQYDQQSNQVICSVGPHSWSTNGPASNTFGLEPNFGCCTANMHQGWPKFTANLWLKSPDGGLVAAAYAPCSVTTIVRDGVEARVVEETSYPFDGTIRLCIQTQQSVTFPLYVRIPGWADGANVSVAGKKMTTAPGQFLRIERTWNNGDVVELVFPLRVTCERRTNNSVSLWRGSLVFSLKIGEEFRRIKSFGPATDYEIWPTTPWNYALDLDCETFVKRVQVESSPITEVPFDPAHPPVRLHLNGRRLGSWDLQEGYHDAAEPPLSPVASTEPLETLTLIPYGSTHLRITEFPVLKHYQTLVHPE